MTHPPEPIPGVAGATTIHDIGYRHYQGPRLGRGYAVRSLLVHSLRGAYGLGRPAKSKVLPFCMFGVMLLPALIGVAVLTLSGKPLLTYAEYLSASGMIPAIFLAAQAPALLSKDLRFRTTALYFSRPITRGDYVLAKFAAMSTALFILLATPLTLMFAGSLLAKLNAWDQLKLYLPALGGAAVGALLFAAIGLLIAALTPRRGFGVAAIIAAFLVSYGAVSALQEVLAESHHWRVAGYLGLFSPPTLLAGFQRWALRMPYEGTGRIDMGIGGGLFVLGVAVVIAGALGLLVLRYRKAGLS